jgi:glyoxylase-like metal-dependent hydrolase (beta-lactamase superfamily II)
MIRETFPVGPLQCNCSILGDETTHQAIVVDPGDDIPGILAVLAKHALSVRQIVITHAHIDHIAAAQRLKEITGAPVTYNQADLAMVAIMDVQAAWLGVPVPDVRPPDADLPDAATVRLAGSDATVIHTPGHTPGSLCLYLPEHSLLLAGDTLFAGSVGRTDLPGGDERQLIRSIHQRLLVLPNDTLVIPGHGKATSIGREREQNPFLRSASSTT